MVWSIVICCNTVCHGVGAFFSLVLPVYRRAGRRWHSACWTRWWWWSWSSPLWSSTSLPMCVQIASTRTTSSPHMSRSELYHWCLRAPDVSDLVIAVAFCVLWPRGLCVFCFSALDISDFVISISFCVLRPVRFCFSALDVLDFVISIHLHPFCVPSDYTFSFLVLETSHILLLLYLYLFCVHGALLHFHFVQHFWTRSLTKWYFTSSDGSSLQTK